MKMQGPPGLLARRILVTACALAACVAAVAVAAWWKGSQSIDRETGQQLLAGARQVGWQIEQLIRERDNDLKEMAQLAGLSDAFRGDQQRLVRDRMIAIRRLHSDPLHEILITDSRNRVVASTDPDRAGRSLAVDRLVTVALASGAYVSRGPIALPGERPRALLIGRPLPTGGPGGAHGWLVALLDWNAIERLMIRTRREGTGHGATEFSVLVDPHGRVLAGEGALPGGAGTPRPGDDELPTEEPRRTRMGGHDYWVVSTPVRAGSLPGTNLWRVLAFRDATPGITMIRVFMLAIIGPALAGLFLAALLFAAKERELARREERMRTILERSLVALLDLSREFSINLNEKQLASAALLGVMGHVGTARASIWLDVEGGQGALACVESCGVTREANDRIGELLAALRAQGDLIEGDPIWIATPPSWVPQELVRIAMLQEFTCLLPVVVGGAVVGFVALGQASAGLASSDAELDAVRATLGMFGAAVENTRLYNRLWSQNRRLEEINEQLQDSNTKLQAAVQLKNEILSNTSHELRTPLTNVIGFLDLVVTGLVDAPESVREFADNGLAAARRLLNLINDLLDFAQMESGRLALNSSSIELEEILKEVESLSRPEAAARGLELRVESEPARGLHVWADRNRLRQVLLQVIGNGIKFTPRGSVSVSVRDDRHAGHFTIEIVDTGIGIPSQVRQRVMEPFVQGDGSSTRRHGGTGIGLAISRGLVEWMGGRIAIDSPEGHEGTRVSISLPGAAKGADATSGQGSNRRLETIQGAPGGPLVLVVEDSDSVRTNVIEILLQGGYRTAGADSADSGWLVARRLRPAAVITDYAMRCAPDSLMRTGLDLAERLGTDPATRRIPILFLTGFASDLRAEMEGLVEPDRAIAILAKPFEIPELLAVLKEWLGNRRIVRVLVAETTEVNASLVAHALPPERFHVEITLGGDHFLDFLRDQPQGFDVLLVNATAPGANGMSLLHDPRFSLLAPDLGIVLLTDAPTGEYGDRVRTGDDHRIRGRISRAEIKTASERLIAALEFHAGVPPASTSEADSDAGDDAGSAPARAA